MSDAVQQVQFNFAPRKCIAHRKVVSPKDSAAVTLSLAHSLPHGVVANVRPITVSGGARSQAQSHQVIRDYVISLGMYDCFESEQPTGEDFMA